MSHNSGGLHVNTVKSGLDKTFFAKWDENPIPGIVQVTDDSVFKQDSTTMGVVTMQEFPGVGLFTETGEEERRKVYTPEAGELYTARMIKWTKTFNISEEYFEDESYGVIENALKDAAFKGRMTQLKNAISVFNNGASTQLVASGKALFATDHEVEGGTESNLISGTFSEATLESVFLALQTQKQLDGEPGGHMPRVLLVPPALFKDAIELTRSELSGADNQVNYFSNTYPGLQVKTSDYLAAKFGGSDTKFYVLSDNHNITRIVRKSITTNLIDSKYDDNDHYVYKMSYREQMATPSWQGVVAATGA